jgi:hypothetical protein
VPGRVELPVELPDVLQRQRLELLVLRGTGQEIRDELEVVD